MTIYLALLAGVLCAGLGGELFVRGTVGLARAARISPGIIATTVAAFATSSPELTVAVASARADAPEISLGDALGSNVVNVALILAAVILVRPIDVPRSVLTRDYPVALLVPVLVGVLLLDGRLSRGEGVLLLAGFLAWIFAVIRQAHAQRSATADVLGQTNSRKAAVDGIIGLALLIAAGKLVVHGATGIAHVYGVNEFVIGSTVVAIGTSIPELATAVISRIRGHDEVGLGTILGSNIFNGLFIVSVAAMIHPISVTLVSALPALVLGIAAVMLSYPPRHGTIDRWRGGMLLAVYAVYLVSTLEVSGP